MDVVAVTEPPVSRPAVSQHLKVLKDAGRVMGALRAELERFWSRALAGYKLVVEQTDEEEP